MNNISEDDTYRDQFFLRVLNKKISEKRTGNNK